MDHFHRAVRATAALSRQLAGRAIVFERLKFLLRANCQLQGEAAHRSVARPGFRNQSAPGANPPLHDDLLVAVVAAEHRAEICADASRSAGTPPS